MAFTKVTRPTDDLNTGWGKVNTLIDDLASTSNAKGASQIGIEDSAGNLSADNVEDAIAEIYSDTASTRTLAEIFDENSATTTGLTWGYKPGSYRVDATVTTVVAGTIGLTDDATNYVEIDPSDGNVKKNTTAFTTGRIPLRQVTTSSGIQTVSTDKRAFFSREATASATTRGIVELATDAETATGTDTERAITPANLASMILDEDDMSTDSNVKVSTQQALKAYVDTTVAAAVPTGVILMWSGTIANIPSGWYLCDGTNGTPNLTDRFVIHADADSGGTNNVGVSGGSKTITAANMPQHNHSVSITTSSNGSHNHTYATTYGSTAGSYPRADKSNTTTINTSTAPNHNHTVSGNTGNKGSGTNYMPKYYALAFIQKG